MASILDRIRSGATGLFSGPMLPGTTRGGQAGHDPGAREGLITAGLATIIAANQGAMPLEALAMGAAQGREAGNLARQDFLNRQTRQQLAEALEQEGYDRQNLTSTAFQLLAAGDLEGAKGVFNILQSLPNPTTQAGVNTRNIEMTADEIRRQGGFVPEGTDGDVVFEVPEDPRTLERFFSRATQKPDSRITGVGLAPDGEWRSFVKASPVADPIWGEISRREGADGGGGALAQVNRSLSAGILQDLDTAYDERLANLPTDLLVRLSQTGPDPGFVRGTAAAIANAGLPPEIQAASAAANRVTGITQRIMSGAQMSDAERQFYRRAFGVVGGDASVTIAQKKEAVRLIAEGLGGGGDNLESVAARAEELASTEEGQAELAEIIRSSAQGAGITPPAGIQSGLPDLRPIGN